MSDAFQSSAAQLLDYVKLMPDSGCVWLSFPKELWRVNIGVFGKSSQEGKPNVGSTSIGLSAFGLMLKLVFFFQNTLTNSIIFQFCS